MKQAPPYTLPSPVSILKKGRVVGGSQAEMQASRMGGRETQKDKREEGRQAMKEAG